MNFDDILGKLMPLFEQKMAFNMEMSKRAMSLEEKKEASKTDLEYRKLEAQITGDKDKLKWEKEKLTTAIKGDYDLQTLKNSGMLDQKRLEGLDAKDKQKIMEEGANARAKLSADTETNKTKLNAETETTKAYLTTLGTILGHAQEVSQTGVDGVTKTSKPTAEVGNAARSLMEQTGLAKPAATPQARNVAGEAEFAAGVLREHEKAGTPDSARNYLNALPADTRQAALALLNPGAAATLATGVAPVTPAPGVRPLVSPVQPAAQAPPVRPEMEVVDRHNRDNPLGGPNPFPGAPIVGAPVAERGPLTSSLMSPSAMGQRALGVFNTPAQVTQANDPARAAAIQKQADADEEARKRRVAVRQARGLTSIGF
jgi:hypothetical protein